ncbi:nitrite reductase, partial [Frankia sp. AgKG'84/4]|nr:nitrite reductase [Frankia sp. AgKG'84/4]
GGPAGAPVGASAGGQGRGVLPVHWSGCTRRCGQPAGGIVEVVAEQGGYRVRRAGGLAPPGGADAALSWAPGAAGELPVGGWETLLGAVSSARGGG